MYESGKSYRFGSVEEGIALWVKNRKRMIQATQAFFYVVSPDKFNELFRFYRGLIFPEEKYDELAYIKKARKMFDKLRNVKMWVAPIVKKKRIRR